MPRSSTSGSPPASLTIPEDAPQLGQITVLHAGRRLILHRCTVARCCATASRVLAILLTSIALFFVAARVLGTASAAPSSYLAATALAVAAALLAATIAARRAYHGAAARWPEIWDQLQQLPQTVTTLEYVLRTESDSAWRKPFLQRTLATLEPLPAPVVGSVYRYRSWALVPALILSAGCGWWLSAGTHAGTDGANPLERGPSAKSSLLGPSGHPPQGQLPDEQRELRSWQQALLSDHEDTRARAKSSEAITAARQATTKWAQQARDRDRVRWRAAAELQASPELAAAAAWLRGDRASLPAPLGALTPDALAALSRATVALTATLNDSTLNDSGAARAGPPLARAATALERWANGDTTAGDFTLAPIGAEFLQARAWSDWLRAPGTELAAQFHGAPTGSSGSDSRGDTEPLQPATTPGADSNTPDTSSAAHTAAPQQPITGTRIGTTTQVSDTPQFGAGGAQPEWQSLLARPEIESRWLPVVHEYLLQQSAQEQPPRKGRP
ncbi:MAG: hypothetical protein AAF581_14490 [Planctomycetota bacterium]